MVTNRVLIGTMTAARALGCTQRTIQELVHRGELEAVKVGRVMKVYEDSVQDYLRRQTIVPSR
jgi:excisionase family DNA binding protein